MKIDSVESDTFQILVKKLKRLKAELQISTEEWRKNPSRYRLYVMCDSDSNPIIQIFVLLWQQAPHFTLLDFKSLQPEKVLNRADLNELFEFVFDDMHSAGRFSFYYATRQRAYQLKYLRNQQELAPVRGLPVFERYDTLLEGVVKPGVEPKFVSHRWLANPDLIKVPYWIKRSSLKTKYVVDYLIE